MFSWCEWGIRNGKLYNQYNSEVMFLVYGKQGKYALIGKQKQI